MSECICHDQINRINSSLRINPYNVLDIPWTRIDDDKLIKKQIRELSRITHPDKNPQCRELAEIAFTAIGKAKHEIHDIERRGELLKLLDTVKTRVRMNMCSSKCQKTLHLLNNSVENTNYIDRVQNEFNELLIDREWRKRQLIKARGEHITTAFKKDREVQLAKLEWEAGIDSRVNNWRAFQKRRSSRAGLQ